MIAAYVWTGLALAGLLFCWVNLREASADTAAVRNAHANGARRILARSTLQSEGIRVGVQVIFLVIGIAAIDAKNLSPRLVAHVIEEGLIFAAALILLQSVLAIRTRRRLRDYLEQVERTK